MGQHGTFALRLTPPSVGWHYDVTQSQPAHQAVLRPLLTKASECFVYGLAREGRVWKQCESILVPRGKRFRVNLAGDPVTGVPLLWNVHSGERGSIVILAAAGTVDLEAMFAQCYAPYFSSNFRTPHNPAAIECARRHVAETGGIAFCLPRNNGLEWIDLFASAGQARGWFEIAQRQCRTET